MRTLLALAITAVCAAPVYAQAPAAEPAAAKPLGSKSVALELIRTIVPKETYEAILEQMTTNMAASMGGRMPPEQAAKLKQVTAEALTYQELLDWSADVYARYFTDKELHDLAAFYKTPTGKKLAKMTPQISGEVGKLMGPMIMRRLPEIMKKHGMQ